ncbi:voltage-dependent anion channel [Ephemerocybe angulata]|uniref:Voltage-dependent anion channel n=1 Tax=Ephemerocybe angulata TaxID=980116 RepID=A0A8H6I7G9_9AGAR|nr:voltage-dependent anion channel [Tulosesus angulatus]
MAVRKPRKTWRHCIRYIIYLHSNLRWKLSNLQPKRSFTPAWFTIIMGTGSVSTLAGRFYFGRGSVALEVICLAFFFLNLGMYIIFIVTTIIRYWLFPHLFSAMLFDPGEALFIGAFPIGTANLIDSALIMNQTYHFGGKGFMYSLWAFWWFDLGVSYLTAFEMIYVMMSTRHHLISETTSLWVLPVIPLIAASATGGNISQALVPLSTTLALLTVTFSLASFMIGMSLTLMMITLFLTRLLLRGPPPPRVVVAGFIIASPFGQGGVSLLANGRALSILFPEYLTGTFPRIELAGQIFYALCMAGAFGLWSMGVCWILISVFTILSVRAREDIPFSLSYWGSVFPNGVFAACTVQLGVVFNSPFFNYLGVIWSGVVFLLWTNAFIPTVYHTWDTSIFPEVTPIPIRPSEQATKSTFDYPQSRNTQRQLATH